MNNALSQILSRHFSKKTLKALDKKGMKIINVTFVPENGGDYANGETAYVIDDNGTCRLKVFLEVLELVK